MPEKKLKIVFLGTPDFAVASLRALVENKYNVVAVVTAPDKPAGRGMKLQQSAVKKFALEHQIPVLQPEKLKDPEFIDELRSYQADVQVVVAFRMLPEVVWNMPPLGTINVHASLLPDYRGAAPINWAIIDGNSETGVSTFKLLHQIDTGHILLQEKVTISPDDTAGCLHDTLMQTGAQLLLKTIAQLETGQLHEIPQTEDGHFRHAPKLFSSTCDINWQQTCAEIHNLIRGLSPYPAAFTQLNGKKIKIFRSEPDIVAHSIQPGHYKTDNKTFLSFACKDGFIHILELQPEGKTRMAIADYLRGNKLP
ncbi:MAG TPA: methionyl-tRNA formyltransferase [Chitinophagaceae bacterium]|nr:methionyl-tRNA formyltransferase [Chitinophagaceae bacterium]